MPAAKPLFRGGTLIANTLCALGDRDYAPSMLVRRAFFYWQFAAAVVLPAWILLGWTLWGRAGEFVGLAIATPFLVLALLAVAGLTYARKSARTDRAASWLDVGVAGAWHAAVIAAGFFGPATPAFAAFSLALGIAAFWSVAWQLVTETRKRVRRVFDTIQRGAIPYGSAPSKQTPLDAGEYLVIRPSDPPR